MIFIQNCKKEPDRVGAEIIPANKKLNVDYSDTATLYAHSRLMDTLRTDNTSKSLFGSYNDPVFGRNDASFYTQLRLASTNPDFGSNPRIDSVILSLLYSGYYGDTLMPHTVHVYEMSEPIYFDSIYYSYQNFSDYGIDFANYTFYPKPTHPVYLQGDTVQAQLRVNLSDYSTDLGYKILSADTSILSDNEKFLEYFYGLHIKVDPVGYSGSILYYNLISSSSELSIYYKNDTADSLSYSLIINQNCARVNHFDHNYESSQDQIFKKQLLGNNPDTSLGAKLLYLQSMGGVETKILFPFIDKWFSTEKVVVNEAKLILPIEDTESDYPEPSSLVLLRINKEGNTVLLEDQSEGPEYFYGDTIVNNSYEFRITRYIQQIMMGNYEDYGLLLYNYGVSVNSDRVVLLGTNPDGKSNNERLKLALKYTIID